MFSDNAASFAAIKELTEQRAALVAQRDELQERFDVHTHACQVGIGQMPAAHSTCLDSHVQLHASS